MSVSPLLQTSPSTATGIVLVVYADPDNPRTTTAQIERCGDSGGAPDNSWTVIGEIQNCDAAGSPFVDYLPSTPTRYWYRAKHTGLGFLDSEYVFEVSGVATALPDVDLAGKPWLLNATPLQLDMVITSETSAHWVVSSSVNQPVTGPTGTPPTITVLSSGNVGTITSIGGGQWTVAKPSISLNASHVTFTSALNGFTDGRDRVQLTSTADLAALTVRSELVSVNGNTYTYAIRGIDPIPENNLTFTMIGTNASVTPTSVTTASNAAFTITVNPTSLGDGRVTIRATAPRRSDGIDAIDISGIANTSAATVSIVDAEVTSLGLPYFAFRALAGSATRDVEVWVTEELAAPSVTQSINYDVVTRRGYQNVGSPYTRVILSDETTWSTSILASKPSSWLTVTLVPIDSNGTIGTAVNRLYPIPATSATAPAAFTARANTSTTSTTTTNTVTLPASNLPTTIRVYRDGVIFANVAVTVGAGATQTLVHSGLLPSTSYVWEYAPVASGVEGSRTAALTVTTAAEQLTPPTGIGAGLVGGRVRFIITDASTFPVGTTFQGDYTNGGGPWLTLNTISGDTLESVETYTGTVSGNARFRALNPSYTTSNNSTPISYTANGSEV